MSRTMIIAVAVLRFILANAFSVTSRQSIKFSSAPAPASPTTSSPPLLYTARHDENDIDEASSMVLVKHSALSCRREALARTATSLLVATLGFDPQQSLAANNSGNTNNGNDEGVISQSRLASLLQQIPTFAIVDPRGVPYFVVGEDAKLTSYFFLDYREAKRILDVAISSSDKAIKEIRKETRVKNNGVLTKQDEEGMGTNPWINARITSVPLDLAVTLASKGKLGGAYFKLAPSSSDIEDALALDGTDDLPEGKVPLFYVENMTISEGTEPLYFQKEQALVEWQRQQKKQAADGKDKKKLPNVKVTELFATLTEMVRPGGTDEELKTLQFVAPADSKAKADLCRKGEKESFRLGERLVVL